MKISSTLLILKIHNFSMYVCYICYCNVLMTMSGTHTEAVLNKLIKSELVQALLKTGATLGTQITDLSKEIKDILTNQKIW